jgi:hypothetical protein
VLLYDVTDMLLTQLSYLNGSRLRSVMGSYTTNECQPIGTQPFTASSSISQRTARWKYPMLPYNVTGMLLPVCYRYCLFGHHCHRYTTLSRVISPRAVIPCQVDRTVRLKIPFSKKLYSSALLRSLSVVFSTPNRSLKVGLCLNKQLRSESGRRMPSHQRNSAY